MDSGRHAVNHDRHGGRLYAFARDRGLPPHAVLDASASINPLGPPSSVLTALQDLPSLLRHYPDDMQWAVRETLGETFGISPNQVWCGNGSTEVIDHVFQVLRPPRTWIVAPAFAEYERIAHRHGSRVGHLLTTPPFAWPLERLDAVLEPRDLVLFNNPHNPSGQAWPRALWEAAVRRWTARHVHVVFDEAFLDFLPDAERYTALPLVRTTGAIVVRSATKMYALPGLRFGWGVGPTDVVQHIDALRDPWNVNQLAQVAARAAYRDTAFRIATWTWLDGAHRWATTTWGMLRGVRLHPSRANFVLLEWSDATLARRVIAGLATHGILVRDLSAWRGLGPHWMRVALRTPEENDRIWQAARQYLGSD